MSTASKPTNAPSRRDSNKAARRETIVSAATKLFGRASYSAVQMDDIAKAADIGKPALYRYFPSKEELFLEVSDRALGDLGQRLIDAGKSDSSPRDMLARMIAILVESLRQHFASLRLLSGEQPVLADDWRRLFRNHRKTINGCLTAVLRKGVTSGDFRPTDADMVPPMIIGMIRGAVMDTPNAPTADVINTATALLLSGVGQNSENERKRNRRKS